MDLKQFIVDKKLFISMIYARNENDGIGSNQKLPWSNKTDMQWFKKNTINKVCIMGKNTFNSLPKPLSDRINIVITKNPPKIYPAAIAEYPFFVSSIEEAIKMGSTFNKEIVFIGGKQIYETIQKMDIVHRIYETVIKDDNITDVHFRAKLKSFNLDYIKVIGSCIFYIWTHECYNQYYNELKDNVESVQRGECVDIPSDIKTADEFYNWLHKP